MYFGKLFLSLVWAPLLWAAVSANSVTRNTCTDPLSCYLESIVIQIPDICQTVEKKELCITNFVCNGINLAGVPSEYEQPTTLNLGVEGLGTSCQGDYSYGKLVSGTATAAINETDFDVGLLIGKSGELPVSTSFSSCDITSMKIHITFTGGLLDTIVPALEKLIAEAVNKLLCSKIPSFLETNVTNAIVNELDPLLLYLISSQPSPLPIYNSHYTAWGDSLVSKVKKIVQRIEGKANLKDFLLCMLDHTSPDDLKKSMIGEFQSLFLSPGSYSYGTDTDSNGGEDGGEGSDGEGVYNVGVTENIVVFAQTNLPAGYNTTLSLTSLRFRGLNSVDTLDLLEPLPSSNITMRSVVGFGELSVELGLEVDIVPMDSATRYSTTNTHTNMNTNTDKNTNQYAAPARDTYTEKLQVTLSMQNVSLLMDLVVAMNSFVLKSYYLDQLSTRNCWLSALEELSIANLQLHTSITTLQAVQVVGSAGALEHDILNVVNNFIELIISPQGFGQLTTDLINGVMQGPVRAGFNSKAAAQLVEAKHNSPCLTHYPYNDKPDYVVWANSTLIRTVDYIVNDLLGYTGINHMMSCATNGTGALALNTSRLSVSLGGLNSFYALRVLSPVLDLYETAKYELESLISLGYCPYAGSADCNPFELMVAFKPKTSVSGTSGSISGGTSGSSVVVAGTSSGTGSDGVYTTSSNKLSDAFVQAVSAFNFAVSLSNLSVYLNTEVQLDKDMLRDTQYQQLSTTGCVGQSFETIAVEKATISIADAELIVDDGAAQRNITHAVRKVLSALTRQEKLNERNSDIAYKLSVAEETCANDGVAPHVTPTDTSGSGSDNLNWQWELFILVVGCLTALILLMAAYNYWGSSGKHYCTGEFLEVKTEEEEGMPLLTRLYHRWDCKSSLLFHAHIPLWIRIAVPLCVLGDVALFIQSNMDPRAVSVMVKIITSAQTIDVGSVFDFGLGSTVVDMWNAGVYPLAVLILFFSGAWPYVKLLSMLTAWLAPPKLLSIERRETVLTVLDVLGKWSLIDFFVMILMLCAFYFNIYIGSLMTIEVTVLPRWGFYSFLLATMVSLGLGHIILACHRLIIEPKVLPIPDDYCPRESLSSITYEIHLNDRDVQYLCASGGGSSAGSAGSASGTNTTNAAYGENTSEGLLNPASSTNNEGESKEEVANEAALEQQSYSEQQRLMMTGDGPAPTPSPNLTLHASHGTTMLVKVTTAGKVAVVLALLLTALFVVAGTFVLSMQFQFKGLVGAILFDRADVDYSFVTVGTSIPEHSGVPNDFATRWLQASLFLFGQAMPFAVLLAMLLLWLVPMTLSMQRSMFVLAEVLNAWSALDVFCIAIAAALLEIQQFAAFIVGDSCDGINEVLKMIDAPGLDGDDKCFDVVATLDEDSWLLFTAAALLIIVVLPLLQMCHHAIHLRLKLSTQASLVLHHLTHGTRPESLRDALRSLSKEQQYGEFGEGQFADKQLVSPLLAEAENGIGGGMSGGVSGGGKGEGVMSPFVSLAAPSAPQVGSSSGGSSGGSETDRTSTASNPLHSSARGSGSASGSVHGSSGSGGDGNGSSGSGRDSTSTTASATTSTSQPTWWSRCTTHNFNVSAMSYLSAARLVELSYTPTVVVDDNVVLSTTNSYAIYAE